MGLVVVNSGIDSLVIGFLIAEYKDPEAFVRLEEAKARAGEKLFGGKGASVTWFGQDFVVMARGTKGYEWVLENADVGFCVARKAQGGTVYPEVYVTFRAEYLWRAGHVAAVKQFEDWLGSWAVIKGERVSRCDLCMDMQMDLPQIDLAQEAVTRAGSKVEYYEPCEGYASGRRKTGYRIGAGALIARIYDKSLEVTKSQKEWFGDIWLSDGWDGQSRVVRVEFQARRDFLKQMLVESFPNLCERLADMWRYYTQKWLTVRVPRSDAHRNRWPLAEWWGVVQRGFTAFGKAYGVLRNRQRELKRGQLMRQLKGVAVSLLAAISAGYEDEQGRSSTLSQLAAIKDISLFLSSVPAWKAVVDRKPTYKGMKLGGGVPNRE